MTRALRLPTSLLALGLALAGCGAGGSDPGQEPAQGCHESGLDVSVTPTGTAAGKRFLAIGLVNCGDAPRLLDSHPNVGVFGGDVTVSRDGNEPETVEVGPGDALIAPLAWTDVPEHAENTLTVDRLLITALPDHHGHPVEVDPAFELLRDHVLELGAWQRPAGDADTEPVETASPATEDEDDQAPATCPEAGFHVTVAQGSAAMGIRSAGIELVNCGQAAIEVDGYPVIEVLQDGSPIQVEVHHGSDTLTDPGPSRIVVEPGESVSAGLLWRNKVESADTGAVVSDPRLSIAYTAGGPAVVVEPESPVDLGTTRYLEVTAWR
ncbi:hypothetical protein GCM10027447_20130 [Glycomyces halotolerans]